MSESFDQIVVTERATVGDEDNHVIVMPGRIYRNGVDIVGGESPEIAKVEDSTGLVDTNRKLNEIIDILLRGGFAREA